jgi:hypothetical protein
LEDNAHRSNTYDQRPLFRVAAGFHKGVTEG